LLPVGILRPIVSAISAVVIGTRARIPARTIVVRAAAVLIRWLPILVRAAAVLIRWLPILAAGRSLRVIRTRRPIISRRPVRLTRRRLLLPRGRPVLGRAILRARKRCQQRRAESQPAQPSSELESLLHRTYIDWLLSASSGSSLCTGCGSSVNGSKFAKMS